jgi:hypothetical protein
MQLTPAQKVTLKAAILADPAAAAHYTNGDTQAVADYMNAPASPSFTVWKTLVPIAQVGDNIVATEMAGLSTINATRLQTIALFSTSGVNPSFADRRAFFDDVFSGAGGVLTRAKLLILWKRLASRTEEVFATGTGSDAVPATLVVEGTLTANDVQGLPNG